MHESYHFHWFVCCRVLKSSWRRVRRKWRALLLNGTLASGCCGGNNSLASLEIFWFRLMYAALRGVVGHASCLC